jgi:hypothetical protein
VPARTLGQNCPGQQVPVACWSKNEPLNSFQMVLSFSEQWKQRLIPSFASALTGSIAMDFAEKALKKVGPVDLV